MQLIILNNVSAFMMGVTDG
jgi:hypothetical protein